MSKLISGLPLLLPMKRFNWFVFSVCLHLISYFFPLCFRWNRSLSECRMSAQGFLCAPSKASCPRCPVFLRVSVTYFKTSFRCEHGRKSITLCGMFVGWLLNVPATCQCISGTDLLRQSYVLPHWDRSCRSNFPSHPVTVYWHGADQSQRWPYNARRLAG